MSKTAKLLKENLNGFNGQASLYELNEPLEGSKFVVVSAVVAPFSGPETYIFPSDKNGSIDSFLELEGSFRGGLDHSKALNNAGYKII